MTYGHTCVFISISHGVPGITLTSPHGCCHLVWVGHKEEEQIVQNQVSSCFLKIKRISQKFSLLQSDVNHPKIKNEQGLVSGVP